jgi:hypothetical protein
VQTCLTERPCEEERRSNHQLYRAELKVQTCLTALYSSGLLRASQGRAGGNASSRVLEVRRNPQIYRAELKVQTCLTALYGSGLLRASQGRVGGNASPRVLEEVFSTAYYQQKQILFALTALSGRQYFSGCLVLLWQSHKITRQ